MSTSDDRRRRALCFECPADAIAEIHRLQQSGYEACGRWNLADICSHLSYYLRGSLEGFDFRLPWIVRALIGRLMLRRVLRRGRMPVGVPTVPASAPKRPKAGDAVAVSASEPTAPETCNAIRECCALLERFESTQQVHPSPLFGRMTVDEWRRLHLIHAAHHLSFLIPVPDGAAGDASSPRSGA